MDLKTGQRWEWNESSGSHLIAEIIDTYTEYGSGVCRCRIVQIYKSVTHHVGQEYSWDMTNSNWSYLAGQDKPE